MAFHFTLLCKFEKSLVETRFLVNTSTLECPRSKQLTSNSSVLTFWMLQDYSSG